MSNCFYIEPMLNFIHMKRCYKIVLVTSMGCLKISVHYYYVEMLHVEPNVIYLSSNTPVEPQQLHII